MVRLLATCFYIGYLPLMPGTGASFFALFIYYLLRNNNFIFAGLTLFLLVIGFWVSTKAEDELKLKDPKEIVIDEFSSQLLVFVFIPFNIINLIIGFSLFRILDIFKLPPIKKLQNLPKGWGIMLDDIAVAIFINLILQVKKFL